MSPGGPQERHHLSGVDRFRRYRREGFSAQGTFTAGRLAAVHRFWRYRHKGSAIWSLAKTTAFALSRPTIAEGGASTGRVYEVVSQKQPTVIGFTEIDWPAMVGNPPALSGTSNTLSVPIVHSPTHQLITHY
jgi:hypothetical protein